jgi:hypothetical protein
MDLRSSGEAGVKQMLRKCTGLSEAAVKQVGVKQMLRKATGRCEAAVKQVSSRWYANLQGPAKAGKCGHVCNAMAMHIKQRHADAIHVSSSAYQYAPVGA